MNLIMTKLLHVRPVLMSIPMAGVVLISAGLLFLSEEGGQAAARQLAREHARAMQQTTTAQVQGAQVAPTAQP